MDRKAEERQPNGTGRGEDASPATGPEGAGDASIAEASEEVLEQALKERDEYLDSLQRLQAEFANYRSRVARESESSSSRAAAEFVEELLPVLDNFERAIEAAVTHDEEVLGEGIEMVYRQLREILDRRGLCEVEAQGEDFDPNHHEAILCQPSNRYDEGKVLDVIEKGYRIHDKVVRPAKVIVSEGASDGKKAK